MGPLEPYGSVGGKHLGSAIYNIKSFDLASVSSAVSAIPDTGVALVLLFSGSCVDVRFEVMNDKGDWEGGVFRCSGFSVFFFYL